MKLKNRILFFLLVLIIEACSSTRPTNFYLLKSIAPTQLEQHESIRKEINIFIKPVKFPEYLNQPLMVFRESEYKIQLSENNRWAEPLNDNFTRVFIENLNIRIAHGHALEYSDLNGIKPDYLLSMEVLRMDVNIENQIVFRVKWALMAEKEKSRIIRRHDEFSIPVVHKNSYESRVEAQSKAIALFADEVAKTVQSIQLKPSEGSFYE